MNSEGIIINELKNLNKNFGEFKESVAKITDDQESRLREVEKRQCPRTPKPSIVYTLITTGFVVLGILIKITNGV